MNNNNIDLFHIIIKMNNINYDLFHIIIKKNNNIELYNKNNRQ